MEKMFMYTDKVEGKVLVVYAKCNCPQRRAHPFRIEVKKCCFCCKLSWRVALFLIAIVILLYGLISFIIWAFLILWRKPSAIYLYVEFPAHATIAIIELLYAECLGFILLLGWIFKKPRMVLIFSWLILFSYVLALGFLAVMLYEGSYVIDALVYSYFGKEYIQEGEMLSDEHIIIETVYYTYTALHAVLLAVFSTYVAILSMSYYEQMKAEQE